MARREMWTCDVCGKEETTEGGSPHPPWAILTLSGFYYDRYSKRLGRVNGAVCGAECLKELLTKALIAVEEIEEWLAADSSRSVRRP